ncbi:EAL and GGDEF domain-containing protein [Aquitalea denitrificans]|uniref:sensor domain-containing protein n=1 Tax=Aquitalea denitrificans TaxID=519081 RepID=UPI001357A915|nr:PAS domain S-box protein [Aquitalea denitrificans]
MVAPARTRFIRLVVAAYCVLALLWILLSDSLLSLLADADTMVQLSTWKGVVFVLMTAVMLYFSLRAVPAAEHNPAAGLLESWSERMSRDRIPAWLAYLFSFLATVAVLGLRHLLPMSVYERPMLIMFMFPIILSALLGGIGPGLLATVLTVAGIDLLASPHFHSAAAEPAFALQWGFLGLCGITVSLFSGLLRGLSERNETHRSLLDAVVSGTSDAVFVKDRQGRYLMVNEAAARFVGRAAADIIGQDDRALFDADSAAALMAGDDAIMKAGKLHAAEEYLRLQDGAEMVFQVSKGPVFGMDGQVVGLFGISRDITRQQQDQQRLQQNEADLRAAQRMAGIGNWSWDVVHDRHEWSSEIYCIYGRAADLPPAVYPEVASYFTPESWASLSALVEQCLQDGKSYQCDAEVIRPDGERRWITARGEALCDAEGRVQRLQGTVQDISERMRLTMQIRSSERRLQQVVEATSDGFWDWDLRTGYVYRSARYYTLTGYRPEDDTHDVQFFRQLLLSDDVAIWQQALNAHLRGETAQMEFDVRLITRSGELRWIRVRGRAVERGDSGEVLRLVGTLSDITERRRLDEDLHLVLNEAGDAIWIADENGRYLFANPSACRMTGHSQSQLLQMHIVDLLAPSSLVVLPSHLRALEEQRFIRSEWELNRVDGSVVVAELTTVRMQDGRYMAFGRDLTEKKAAERTLQSREQQLARVIEGSDQGYWDWNVQTDDFQVSLRWKAMLGYEPDAMDITRQVWLSHIHPEDLPLVEDTMQRHLDGLTPAYEMEMRCKSLRGGWRWILSRGRVVERDENGQPLMMSGTHTDITEHKIHALAQKEAAIVFDSSYEGIMVVSPARRITKVNTAFTRITGFAENEALGQSPGILSSGQHGPGFYQEMWSMVRQHDFWRGEIWNRRKNGDLYAELLSISVVRDQFGQIQHYIGIFSDITQLKAHEAELNRIANYDPLTGVPNRRLLSDRLEQALTRSRRKGQTCAVCFLDLDGFKTVNDLHGHESGDQLLIAVTERLKGVLRADDTLARLGGDEFVLLLSDLDGSDECIPILDRVLSAVSQEVIIDKACISTSASVGVTLYPQDDADADTLLRHADQAMYQAKEAGKNRYQLFDPESDRKAQLHRRTLESLGRALQQQQFLLYYQPKVDLTDGRVIGVEALIRWRHPERGLLAPADFLPALQNSELEVTFGRWVLEESMAQAARWQEDSMAMAISVNISANYLLHPDFYSHLQQVMQRHPVVNPAQLELEVLESAALDDMEEALRVMQQCRALGVHFALDDFGTGYSSLTYLRKLPLDTLKIDQSFVLGMLDDADDLGIVAGVIQLATVFKRQVIAEGVETLEHGAALRQMGCSQVQGYGIAAPMPAAALSAWASQWQQQGVWQQLGDGPSI